MGCFVVLLFNKTVNLVLSTGIQSKACTTGLGFIHCRWVNCCFVVLLFCCIVVLLFCCIVVLLFNKTVNLVLSTGIQSKACTTGLGFVHCRWVVLLYCCFVVLLFCCLTRQSTQFYQQVYKARPVPLGYASSTVDGLFCCFVVLLFCCLTRQSTQFYQQVYKARPMYHWVRLRPLQMGCFVVLLFNKTVNLVLSTGIQSKACTTGLRFVHCRWVVLLFCCLTRQSTQFYQQVYKARPVPLGYASSTVDGLFCCFVV